MSWCILGESMIGTAHRVRDIACQDAFRFRVFGPMEEWLVVAVADGAGSASHSELGAIRACDEFVHRVQGLDAELLATREGMIALFADVRDVIIAEAERIGVRSRELACTALVAVVGPATATVAQVGDGAIVLGDGQSYRVAFWPKPTEYANATDFLTDDHFVEALRFDVTNDPLSELALFTDGLQRLALDYPARAPHAAFFRPFFRDVRVAADLEALVEPYRAFLDSPRVNERTDDDKTLVIAIRHP